MEHNHGNHIVLEEAPCANKIDHEREEQAHECVHTEHIDDQITIVLPQHVCIGPIIIVIVDNNVSKLKKIKEKKK